MDPLPVIANSSTPLSAGNVFTKENAAAAGTFAKSQASEVSRLASQGDFSLRLFATLGGLALMTSSILSFIGRFLTLRWVGAIICVYTLFLGSFMILLEGKRLPFSESFETNLTKYALFLKYVWGRGMLYFIAGTLAISCGGLLDFIVGGFVCLVGLAFIITGRHSASKLRALKTSQFSESTIRAEFNSASGSASHIDLMQFKELVQALNVDLNRRELEAAFMQVEKADREKITFAEFKRWWNEMDHDDI